MPKCALCDAEAAEVCLPTSRIPDGFIRMPGALDPSICPHDAKKAKPPNPWALPDYVPPSQSSVTGQWGSPPQPGPEELAAWAKAHEPLDLSHEEARTYFYLGVFSGSN
jgi:hypothetical protein